MQKEVSLTASPILAAFSNLSSDHGCRADGLLGQSVYENSSTVTYEHPNNECDGKTRNEKYVVTLPQRAVILRWIIQQTSEPMTKALRSGTVQCFPQFFRGTAKANLQ
eukprot:gb/GEZJ01006621.1/.p1 GENE.gb/GEZJ01006621.1/~~gb/GEZJ01006621.1/.p1  ORF type:complete len:108 (-),score=5.71 gb/GEZJ01006621.1/:717-1040(-)